MIDLITNTFEYLEDDLAFDYHLKTKKNSPKSIIGYYRENIHIELTIFHLKKSFHLNYTQEKDESYLITSTLNKLLFIGQNSEEDVQKSKQTLIDFMDKKRQSKNDCL
jgi:hypothetical protein